jgi:hypothetical protein
VLQVTFQPSQVAEMGLMSFATRVGPSVRRSAGGEPLNGDS